MSPGRITAVAGVTVGHHTDTEAVTGCTVVMFPPETTGARALLGGAPATRESDVHRPTTLVSALHAVVLTGGSAFGLAAADGVMQALEQRGTGLPFGGATVPIVPAAALFDLAIGDGSVRPGPRQGLAALEAASADVAEGSVGAGTGAVVAKWAGAEHAWKGGIGTASVSHEGVTVGALIACNAVGDVIDDDGAPIAATRAGPDAEGRWRHPTNTVIGVVATDARLDKAQATRVAQMAGAGIARAVRPAHTPYDGDILFVGATGRTQAHPVRVGMLAADVVAEAIRRGVRAASALGGVPAVADR